MSIVSVGDAGLKEVTCLLAREGVGVSLAIGVDSHDLRSEAGGTEMLAGLRTLQADPATEVILLIASSPAEGAAHRVLDGVRKSDRPTVICFLGMDRHLAWRAGGIPASRLDEAAMRAAAWVRGWDQALISSRLEDMDDQLATQARELQALAGPNRSAILALLTSQVLCYEAELMIAEAGGASAASHCRVIDARPEMAERLQLLQDALASPELAMILLDIEAGGPTHPDPSRSIAQLVEKKRDRPLVITHLCGSGKDLSLLDRTAATLRDAGITVTPSNASGARLAGMVQARLGGAIEAQNSEELSVNNSQALDKAALDKA